MQARNNVLSVTAIPAHGGAIGRHEDSGKVPVGKSRAIVNVI